MSEIINLSTRVVVMREGKIAGTLDRGELTQEKIMAYAMRGSEENESV